MRCPITQVGCLSACAGVMCSKSASGVLRNGPPEAVSQICLTSFGCAAAQALVNGVVLAVDGQQIDVVLAGRGEDEIARSDEAFLVGQTDGLAAQNGCIGGFEPRDADDRRDDEVGLRKRGHANRSRCAVDDFDSGDSCGLELRCEFGCELLGGHRDQLRTPALALGEGCIDVRACGQRDRMKALRMRLAEAEGALADGAGRAEEGNLLHLAILRKSSEAKH